MQEIWVNQNMLTSGAAQLPGVEGNLYINSLSRTTKVHVACCPEKNCINETMTVHSVILKINDEKSYHPFLSDDKKHDQQFVKLVLEKMLYTATAMSQWSIYMYNLLLQRRDYYYPTKNLSPY